MNRERAVGWGAIGIAAGVVCLGAVLSLRYCREPRYDGRTLSAWLRLGRNIRSSDFIQASNAICTIGTNAIPHLIRLVQSKDSNLTFRLKQVASKLSLFRFEYAGEPRSDAVTGFFVLGAAALPAITDLARVAVEQKNEEACHCLIALGRPAAAILKEMLKNPDPRYRHLATHCLMYLDYDIVEDVVPILLQQMQDGDWETRRSSGYNLEYYFNPQPWMSKMNPMSMPVLQPRPNMPDQRIFYDALIPRLKDSRPEVRVMAVGLLGRLRSVAKPAVLLIVERLADPDPTVRYYASNALNLIDGKVEGAPPQYSK
jgi:HEAT repeat protein